MADDADDDADDDAIDVNAVHDIVRRAVAGIHVNARGQTMLEIVGDADLWLHQQQQQHPQFPLITTNDMRFIVRSLQQNPTAVDELAFRWLYLTQRAVDTLRAYFASNTMALLSIRFHNVPLVPANNGHQLLSGLHGNNSVTQLFLCDVGWQGQAGGTVLSALLQNNLLTTLFWNSNRLGVEGARALEPGLGANQTLQHFALTKCDLGDDGLSIIVDALAPRNHPIILIELSHNGFTSTRGLPHVTRLIQLRPLYFIHLDLNPGLFDNPDNVAPFLVALQQDSHVRQLRVNFCRLPGSVVVALLQVLSRRAVSINLFVYDDDQVHGVDLDRLLEGIAGMRNVKELYINLDFRNERVLSALRRNASLCRMGVRAAGISHVVWEEITSGPVFDIMTRNKFLSWANNLLASESSSLTIPMPRGNWSNVIARLYLVDNTRNNNNNDHINNNDNSRTRRYEYTTGATAVYTIMQNRLATWFESHATASAPSPPGAAAAGAAMRIVSMVASNKNVSTTDKENGATVNSKRLRGDPEESTNDDNDDQDDAAMSSQRMEPGQKNKRPR
jgi:hypothetical protein